MSHTAFFQNYIKILYHQLNQFIKKLICDLISQLIFKLFKQIKGYFQVILIVYNMYNDY